jgi:hypothetical protein
LSSARLSAPRPTKVNTDPSSPLGSDQTALVIRPGDEIHVDGGQRLRVLDVVPLDEEDESRFVGLLQVEAA